MSLEKFMQSAPMLRFAEEEWPSSIFKELEECPKRPARQQIKAIEAHLRGGGLKDAFKYASKQKEKAEADKKKNAEVAFWNAFIKWFSPEYARTGGMREELEKHLKDAGLWNDDKKKNRQLRWDCALLLAPGFVQTWCAHCNYLDNKEKRGFPPDERG